MLGIISSVTTFGVIHMEDVTREEFQPDERGVERDFIQEGNTDFAGA